MLATGDQAPRELASPHLRRCSMARVAMAMKLKSRVVALASPLLRLRLRPWQVRVSN